MVYDIAKKKHILFLSDLVSTEKGYGSILIKHIVKESEKINAELLTTPWNDDLIVYYNKNGFYTIKEHKRRLIMKYDIKKISMEDLFTTLIESKFGI